MLLIGTGTSSVHIKAISNEVTERLKKSGYGKMIRGVELDREWVLIDLYDIVINLMLNETREFYSLEKTLVWRTIILKVNKLLSSDNENLYYCNM